MSDVKKYEARIMKMVEQDYERPDIVRELAQEYKLTYNEAEPIVDATILRNMGYKRRFAG